MTTPNIMTPDSLASQTQPFQVATKNLVQQAERAEITSAEHYGMATDLASLIKAQLKNLEDARKSLVKPLNDHVKWMNSQFKPITDELDKAMAQIKNKMITFSRIEEARLREEEAAARMKVEEEALARAEQLEKEGNKEQADAVVNAAADLPTKATKMAPTRGTLGGTASTRKVMKFRITNKNLVPENYKVVDEVAIRSAVRSGCTKIPGVDIYEDTQVAIR